MADSFNNNEQAAFFNAKAATWDAKDKHASALPGLFTELAGIHENSCVLDIGCGTGIMFEAFIQAHAHHITALDLSTEMLKQAQQKANETFTLLNKDIYTFKTAERFNAVIMCNVYPHLGDKAQLVDIIKRLLAPGGRFLVCHTLSKDALNAVHAEHMHKNEQHSCSEHDDNHGTAYEQGVQHESEHGSAQSECGHSSVHEHAHEHAHEAPSYNSATCGHAHENNTLTACMPRCHAHVLKDIPTEIACWENDFVIDVRADTPLFYCFGGYKREQ